MFEFVCSHFISLYVFLHSHCMTGHSSPCNPRFEQDSDLPQPPSPVKQVDSNCCNDFSLLLSL